MISDTSKILCLMIVAAVFGTACGEALVGKVGGDVDSDAGACEHCEHCESDAELADEKDGSEATGEESVLPNKKEEVASENGTEEGQEKQDAKEDSVEAAGEGESKEAGGEDKSSD